LTHIVNPAAPELTMCGAKTNESLMYYHYIRSDVTCEICSNIIKALHRVKPCSEGWSWRIRKEFIITEEMINERRKELRARGWDENTVKKLERLLRQKKTDSDTSEWTTVLWFKTIWKNEIMQFEEIMNSLNLAITPEMQNYSDQRTQKHIDRVEKNYQELAAKFNLNDQPRLHDDSKMNSLEEASPYVWVNWWYKCKREGHPIVLEPSVKAATDAATMHHILNNRHHPEFYSEDPVKLGDNRDKLERAINIKEMPIEDVAEMVADWQAMSQELKTNTARDWFEKVDEKRWIFKQKNRDQILKFLTAFE
jgi:hypothetical protein